jgi:hypothetical protein
LDGWIEMNLQIRAMGWNHVWTKGKMHFGGDRRNKGEQVDWAGMYRCHGVAEPMWFRVGENGSG